MERKRKAPQEEGPSKKSKCITVVLPRDILLLLFGQLFTEVYNGSYLLPQICKDWQKVWKSLEDTRFLAYFLAREARPLLVMSTLMQYLTLGSLKKDGYWSYIPARVGLEFPSCKICTPTQEWALKPTDPKTGYYRENGILTFLPPQRGTVIFAIAAAHKPQNIVEEVLAKIPMRGIGGLPFEDIFLEKLKQNTGFRVEVRKIFRDVGFAGLF